MAKVRSPNYPVVDLSGALVMARKLFDKDGRNRVSKQALASHLGHDTLSGPALGKIGALRAYGLVDGNGDDNRITDDAVTALMAPDGTPDKAEALRRLAFAPGLFREIRKDFLSPPSDSNLRYWLVKRGFSAEAAAKAAKTYLATVALVTNAERDYVQHSAPTIEEMAMQAMEPSTPMPSRSSVAPGAVLASPLEPGTRREVITLDEGDVVITFPASLSPISFQDLEAHLELFVRKMQRRAAVSPPVLVLEEEEEEEDESDDQDGSGKGIFG
jgi:hypothetical protein